jgi:hypothetical protein
MVVSSEGDAGDICYLSSILSKLDGGPHTVLLKSSPITKAKGEVGVRMLDALVSPLLNSQPYIAECRIARAEDQVDWPSEEFRKRGYSRGNTLLGAHLDHLVETKGIGHGITGAESWLQAEPSNETAGKVVINRTGRYRNPSFYWERLVRHYSHRLVFVGLPHEWREFCAHFGYVDFRPTSNLLEVAELIAGSELFVGNQSCAYAIAEGLKHRTIQETSLTHPDCIFKRPNAQYSTNGGCRLPDVDGSGELELVPRMPDVGNVSTMISPPGNWQFPGVAPCPDFSVVLKNVMRMPEFADKSKEECHAIIIIHTLERCPRWGRNEVDTAMAEVALQAAGYC